MQLKNLRINNCMSFKHYTSWPQDSWHMSCSDQTMSIIIGPNGSGKSNILNIIYTCLRAGLLYDYQLTQTGQQYHIHKKHTPISLTPHYDSTSSHGSVKLELTLSNHDRENMIFLHKFQSQVQDIAQTYSDTTISLPHVDRQQLEKCDQISLVCDIDYDARTINIQEKGLNQAQLFALYTMHYHELIQHCMTIYNTSLKKSDQRAWYPLKQTFAILWSYRDSSYFSPQSGSKTSNELQQLLEQLSHHSQDGLSSNIWRSLLQSKLIQDFVNKSDTITSAIQQLCITYIWTRIHIQHTPGSDFVFLLEDELGHRFQINELSSGEKSLLHIISTVYGYDMQDGLVLIDEPELHLHPQLQQCCIQLINDLSKQLKIQWIIATHSPAMVTHETIHHVVRCFRDQGHTNIIQPQTRLMQDDGMLFQMLRFSNVAKIFFIDTLIMVEGDTDEYFFYHLLDQYKKDQPRWAQIENYEILNINGKGSYKKRKGFLNKFGIKSAYIGDRDNIMQEVHTNRDHVYHGFHSYLRKQWWPIHISKSKKYQHLIGYIKTELSNLYQDIMVKIDNLKKADIYILTQWDIEAYLWLREKGIEPTVKFCEHRFDHRMTDPAFESKRAELSKIMQRIFQK